MASVASAGASVPAYLLPGPPVVQPAHLDGDPTLATEILPGPPALAAVQAAAYRRGAPAPSYLPTTDPGSSYVGLAAQGALAPPIDPDEPRRKRARTDKGRAYDVSARLVNGAPAALAVTAPLLDDEPIASSSQDIILLDGPPLTTPPEPPTAADPVGEAAMTSDAASGRSRRARTRGKEKAPLVRVKDEPVTISLSQMEPPPLTTTTRAMRNDDHCSSCRTVAVGGGLVYCDSCPRAFHFMCLNPPLNPEDVGDGDWFCPACAPPPASIARNRNSLLGPLIQHVQTSVPVEFQLPEDVRGFFKDVGSDARGGYMDTSKIRQGRLDRHGRPEERDPYRLRDRNGGPVICFRCGQSSLPLDDPGPAASASKRPRRTTTVKTVNNDSGRLIVSCDYCDLHWHFDCLDPPLMALPSSAKKWMCPAHAEHVVPRPRIPRLHNPPIDITRPGQKNNGNIEVIRSDVTAPHPRRVETDEAIINGQRYRIPERIITLDFWSKLSRDKRGTDLDDTSSLSTLTSLDSDDRELSEPWDTEQTAVRTSEDLQLAKILCDMKYNLLHYPHVPEPVLEPVVEKTLVSTSTQTDFVVNNPANSRSSVVTNGLVKIEPVSSQPSASGRRSRSRRGPVQPSPPVLPPVPERAAIATPQPQTSTISSASLERPRSPEKRTRASRSTRRSSAAAKTLPAASAHTTDKSAARSPDDASASATPRAKSSPSKPVDVSPGTSLKIRLPPRTAEHANGASASANDVLPTLPLASLSIAPTQDSAAPATRTRRKSTKARQAMGVDNQDMPA